MAAIQSDARILGPVNQSLAPGISLGGQGGKGHVVCSCLVYTELRKGRKMNCHSNRIVAALCAAAIATIPQAALAQSSFRNYRCADGSQFIVGFFQYDKRAHLQLDGKALTLPKRVSLSGSRYQAKGVTLRITKGGVTTLKHAKRPTTTCEQT
jgi:membrane-bound inhibitor of C-type lysozyme